ncbi:MAG: methylmalonyl Co-A mutase-associated GTPase MeaB [Rhodospirillales bacterium]|jgi:LAO/AO transport system kinase|nr:methylmalonyl Co-A mutase-associated GTPase MeaB [Rhodospirillales bacterium]MBT4039508.1 methylmalonyl Co-A mutase-associated GTPase MeaB [Rhodospirillales bacterium]MBT4626750.1 methylmalonyl Co-A mutase-associated GTPase MeaB [Rhodospirillales bacterium]MBT5520261.1 methylmalonyl Co-A mutase-associated GTPase MeaB [Rhodospirillales bacterium]MBT6108679.1 methylmalonyl Co-A mutase-associated GTPase MeaB [Rhodospirillales bacterium]
MANLTPASQALLDGVLAGDVRSIARTMSLAESLTRNEDTRALFATIYNRAGRAHTIGLTGVPGSGKSTMVRAMAQHLRAAGRTVGIVAIDPSSPFSGGAILGDRVRMGELAGDDGVFIRSMATRGSLGGLTRGCMETVDTLDAAGFDVVLIETVGVGQDEVDIARSALSVAVVSAPGLGDDIQAIKAGVLEIADMHVVSKCDRKDADRTVADLKSMVGMGLSGRNRLGWQVPVISTSAEKEQGIDELIRTLDAHLEHLNTSGEREIRAQEISHMRVIKAAEDIARERVAAAKGKALDDAMAQVSNRDLDPYSAAQILINLDSGNAEA